LRFAVSFSQEYWSRTRIHQRRGNAIPPRDERFIHPFIHSVCSFFFVCVCVCLFVGLMFVFLPGWCLYGIVHQYDRRWFSLPHGEIGQENGQITDLGHRRTRAIPYDHQRLLSRRRWDHPGVRRNIGGIVGPCARLVEGGESVRRRGDGQIIGGEQIGSYLRSRRHVRTSAGIGRRIGHPIDWDQCQICQECRRSILDIGRWIDSTTPCTRRQQGWYRWERFQWKFRWWDRSGECREKGELL